MVHSMGTIKFRVWNGNTNGGNGNPLQCSCLEDPRDRAARWAAVYGVAQSRTRLKRLSSSRDGKRSRKWEARVFKCLSECVLSSPRTRMGIEIVRKEWVVGSEEVGREQQWGAKDEAGVKGQQGADLQRVWKASKELTSSRQTKQEQEKKADSTPLPWDERSAVLSLRPCFLRLLAIFLSGMDSGLLIAGKEARKNAPGRGCAQGRPRVGRTQAWTPASTPLSFVASSSPPPSVVKTKKLLGGPAGGSERGRNQAGWTDVFREACDQGRRKARWKPLVLVLLWAPRVGCKSLALLKHLWNGLGGF